MIVAIKGIIPETPSERAMLGLGADEWVRILGGFLSGGLVLKIADSVLNRSKVRADVTVTFTDQVMDYSDRLKADLKEIRDRLSASEAENAELRKALNAMLDENSSIKRERAALVARVAELEAEVRALRQSGGTS